MMDRIVLFQKFMIIHVYHGFVDSCILAQGTGNMQNAIIYV